MNRTERRGAVFLVLSAYVGASIVAAAVLSPPGGLLRTAVFPGVFYLAAVRALAAFADIATVGPTAMNALYAVLAYIGWGVAAYLAGARGFGCARGELKAMALAYPGVIGVVASVVLLAAGTLGAAGLLDESLSRTAFLVAVLVGAVLWVPSLVWLSKVRTTRFGWQSRALEHVDAAVEVSAYVLLLVGLALVGVAVALAVGPQYLVVSSLSLVVVAVTVVLPTGGAREPDTGFG